MAFPVPTNAEVAQHMDVTFTAIGDAECTRLIPQARRWVTRACRKTFDDTTDTQDTIDDIKELVSRIVERLFYQKPLREFFAKPYKAEWLGDYKYERFDPLLTTTGDPEIDTIVEFYQKKEGLGISQTMRVGGRSRYEEEQETATPSWLQPYL
jgi:hypothetical protein